DGARAEGGRPRRRAGVAAAAAGRLPAHDRFRRGRHQEHGRPVGECAHRGFVPAGVRRNGAVGPSRHRRPGARRQRRRLHAQGAHRLRRTHARRAGLVVHPSLRAAGYACALVLAFVFALAGTAKLARRRETAVAFGGLGLPAPGAFAVGVPVLELTLTVLLTVVPVAGAAVALVALAAFTVVLARALRAGVTTGCNCFGSVRATPISRANLVRNAALAAVAIFVLVARQAGA